MAESSTDAYWGSTPRCSAFAAVEREGARWGEQKELRPVNKSFLTIGTDDYHYKTNDDY